MKGRSKGQGFRTSNVGRGRGAAPRTTTSNLVSGPVSPGNYTFTNVKNSKVIARMQVNKTAPFVTVWTDDDVRVEITTEEFKLTQTLNQRDEVTDASKHKSHPCLYYPFCKYGPECTFIHPPDTSVYKHDGCEIIVDVLVAIRVLVLSRTILQDGSRAPVDEDGSGGPYFLAGKVGRNRMNSKFEDNNDVSMWTIPSGIVNADKIGHDFTPTPDKYSDVPMHVRWSNDPGKLNIVELKKAAATIVKNDTGYDFDPEDIIFIDNQQKVVSPSTRVDPSWGDKVDTTRLDLYTLAVDEVKRKSYSIYSRSKNVRRGLDSLMFVATQTMLEEMMEADKTHGNPPQFSLSDFYLKRVLQYVPSKPDASSIHEKWAWATDALVSKAYGPHQDRRVKEEQKLQPPAADRTEELMQEVQKTKIDETPTAVLTPVVPGRQLIDGKPVDQTYVTPLEAAFLASLKAPTTKTDDSPTEDAAGDGSSSKSPGNRASTSAENETLTKEVEAVAQPSECGSSTVGSGEIMDDKSLEPLPKHVDDLIQYLSTHFGGDFLGEDDVVLAEKVTFTTDSRSIRVNYYTDGLIDMSANKNKSTRRFFHLKWETNKRERLILMMVRVPPKPKSNKSFVSLRDYSGSMGEVQHASVDLNRSGSTPMNSLERNIMDAIVDNLLTVP